METVAGCFWSNGRIFWLFATSEVTIATQFSLTDLILETELSLDGQWTFLHEL
jgi:glucose uptake protein GlcU